MIISEFGGGLGDVVTLVYCSERYNILEKLPAGERAMVVMMCHNPYAKEIFLWHPKRSQIDLRDVGFWWPWENDQKRILHGLPKAQPFHYVPQESAKFYPSPEDLKVLETLESFPFIVMNAAAGSLDRNIPDAMCEDIAEGIVKNGHDKHGLRVVVVGRSFNPAGRREHLFVKRGGLIDLTDRLSVPGVFELVSRSAGVVCCHSAICLLAWRMKKPVFLAYPTEVRDREFFKPAHQYTYGKDFKTTMHLDFPSYSRKEIETFVEMVGLLRAQSH